MAQVKPDPILVREQLNALQAMLRAFGPELMLQSMFWILAKAKTSFSGVERTSLVPFQYNRIQRWLEAHLRLRNLLLKARQIGGTTYFSLRRLLLPAITDTGIGCALISQSNEYVEKHFRIIRRAYRYIGAVDPYNMEANQLCLSLRANLLHTATTTKRELIFDQIDSTVMVMSAEVEESGQGVSLHHILADEYSRWPGKPEETLSNVQGALVKDGTLDKNCTANGAAGPFYEDCLRAMNNPSESDAVLHFFSWWADDGYFLPVTEKEKDEMEADLTSEELHVIAKMHKELSDVAWTGPKTNQAFVL